MHRAIIFDLGQVLVPFDFGRAYRRMAALCPYTVEEIRARIASTDLFPRFESGLIAPRDFARQLCAMLDAEIPYADFREIWSSIFFPETLIGEPLVAGLKRGYRLVLLSNTNAIHFDMLRENYPLLRHFDAFVLSHEVKALKPSPEIYAAAIDAARCAPSECFYTDDIAEYVDAARSQGIDAVQFQSAAQIEGELRRRGIEWELAQAPRS